MPVIVMSIILSARILSVPTDDLKLKDSIR